MKDFPLSQMNVFILANSADPDGMPLYSAFRLVCQSTHLVVSSTHRANTRQAQISLLISCKVKPVLSGHSKIDKTKVLKTNGSFNNEGQKYCRMLSWSILQYF